MAEYTENYNLKKPAQEDFYNVEDFNNNADVIDKELKAVSDKANSALPATSYTSTDILNKLKTVDGANSGLDADLFKGKSVIPIENGGTGADTIQTANQAIFNGQTSIQSNTDLTTPGLYLCAADATAKTIKNTPFEAGNEHGFTLMVVQGPSGKTQFLTTWTNDTLTPDKHYISQMYIRNQYPSNFSNPWITLVSNFNINSFIQSALQSGGVSVVKSIQRGIINIPRDYETATAKISSVNINKAVVLFSGISFMNEITNFSRIELTNATTVTATRFSDNSNDVYVPYQVLEFY